MRLSGRHVNPEVVVMRDTARPIRLRAAGLAYMFTADEAVELATQLADAVDEIRTNNRKATP